MYSIVSQEKKPNFQILKQLKSLGEIFISPNNKNPMAQISLDEEILTLACFAIEYGIINKTEFDMFMEDLETKSNAHKHCVIDILSDLLYI
jgi:hypothetical protein